VLEVLKEPKGGKPRSDLLDDLSVQARRQRALDWLTGAKPSEPERDDVARVLDAIVTNQPEKNLEEVLRALKAMKTWVHPSNFNALCKLLNDRSFDRTSPKPGFEACSLAMQIIGKQEDERAAAAVATMLVSEPFLQNEAKNVLIQMGPIAAKEVTKYLQHEDEGVREAAKTVLAFIQAKNKK
jgi:HEAT repeat protein